MSYIKHPATCSKFEYTVSAIYTCCGMLRTRKLVSAAADLLARGELHCASASDSTPVHVLRCRIAPYVSRVCRCGSRRPFVARPDARPGEDCQGAEDGARPKAAISATGERGTRAFVRHTHHVCISPTATRSHPLTCACRAAALPCQEAAADG